MASAGHLCIITPGVKELCKPEADIQISWANQRLERKCSSDRAGQRAFGSRWPRLKIRVALLSDADCLADLRHTPGNWHPLTADRAGQWSASVDGNHRLIFEPDHESLPYLSDGGLDTAQVTKVKIIEVADYHGR